MAQSLELGRVGARGSSKLRNSLIRADSVEKSASLLARPSSKKAAALARDGRASPGGPRSRARNYRAQDTSSRHHQTTEGEDASSHSFDQDLDSEYKKNVNLQNLKQTI